MHDDLTLRTVDSFDALLRTPFEGACNALRWRRELKGDFDEVLAALDLTEDIQPVDEDWLRDAALSPNGRLAASVLLEDLRLLQDAGHEPELNAIGAYPMDPDEELPTDVYSFHVDSATAPTDTFLCCYAGRTSEGLRRADAIRTVDVPELRARLLASFGGADGGSFEAFLKETHQDLHFVERPGARPFSFGHGQLWRLAVQYPGAPVEAFIHRAPRHEPGDGRRLLLIS
ncbi:hypothetical protein Poly30_42800 [Planctomycetes bacterium Poly30]|uniref:DUF1826 domain-containing protein n=1 Tax=Saltatorellus ferox TaxID=2528018 RepID=A0A518EXD0_9BACT|nr:hypothetical protein Poly30_42800 [Planctomycetes bacterium Poly30]